MMDRTNIVFPTPVSLSSRSVSKQRVITFVTAFFVALLAVAVLVGCVATGGQLPAPSAAMTAPYNGTIESALNYAMPVAEVVSDSASSETYVAVSTAGSRANVRSGPSLDGKIVGKANPGDLLKVLGKTDDGAWWQVCCVRGADEAEGEATTNGWVSNSVVRLAGKGGNVNVTEPLLGTAITATWQVDWVCESDRCTLPQCSALVSAGVERKGVQQFVPVSYKVQWADECFSTDAWTFDVDRFSGRERSGEFDDNFLLSYWKGAPPGPLTGVYRFTDTVGIVASCAAPQTVEVEEGDGWTSVYDGVTCHDMRTGMLLYMNYTKRWLFTGDYEGQAFTRAFFGDTEKVEQRLTGTNVELQFVNRIR